MRAVKRLHARNKKTACEYTHLQVWVWDACNLHKSFNYNSLNVCTETIGFRIIHKIVDEHELVNALCWAFLWIRNASVGTSKINLHLFRFP